jgi:hypothetical protein
MSGNRFTAKFLSRDFFDTFLVVNRRMTSEGCRLILEGTGRMPNSGRVAQLVEHWSPKLGVLVQIESRPPFGISFRG